MDWSLYLFLAPLGLVTFGIVGILAYFGARRRLPRVAKGIAVATGLLLVLSIVPAPFPQRVGLLGGTVTGRATIPVDAAASAPLTLTGPGNATIRGGALAIDCPSACYFSAGTASLHVPPYARGVALRGDSVSLNGSVTLWSGLQGCAEVPILFATLFGAFPCEPACRDMLSANGTGDVRLVASSSKLCT